MGAPEIFIQLLPEILLVILAFLVLGLGLAAKKRPTTMPGWVTVSGLLITIAASLYLMATRPQPQLIWGGMLRLDAAASIFGILFMCGAIITVLFAMDDENLYTNSEFYFLLVISTLGLMMLAASADLIMVFLSLETTSIPLYILAGFSHREPRSVEAGLKYMLYGAMSSAILLFGFTFLYGFSGTTHLYEINKAIQIGQIPPVAMAAVIILILAGLGYKISAVPFHFWAPDVYEGAPTIVTGFLSTVSKGRRICRSVTVGFHRFSGAFKCHILFAGGNGGRQYGCG